MIKASLQKQAFVTLGRRSNTHGAAVQYGYDGKRVVLPDKVTTTQRGLGMCRGVLAAGDLLLIGHIPCPRVYQGKRSRFGSIHSV